MGFGEGVGNRLECIDKFGKSGFGVENCFGEGDGESVRMLKLI